MFRRQVLSKILVKLFVTTLIVFGGYVSLNHESPKAVNTPQTLVYFEFEDSMPEYTRLLIEIEDEKDANFTEFSEGYVDFPEDYPDVTKILAPPIVKEELNEVFPWENSKIPLLDCDKRRDEERIALACNIYHEARSESEEGQWAVALVTRNRVNSSSFPNTYSDVVWQIRRSKKTKRRVAQFSWALDGKHDKVWDRESWREAWRIAGLVISETSDIKDVTGGALWYHTKKVSPPWRTAYNVSTIIGQHIFYTD